uniref:Uncharacterized protein n=1 Tax=Timema bartmani TaxID=61472 RepID=A0A7R9FCZ7_9NEOP|nr:unnamed protein product [Timema bartmani]
MYEIYNWEKIYKIDHKTRPLDKRLRPFELPDANPFKRRYNDHTPEYMPKALRPAGKQKGMFYQYTPPSGQRSNSGRVSQFLMRCGLVKMCSDIAEPSCGVLMVQ